MRITIKTSVGTTEILTWYLTNNDLQLQKPSPVIRTQNISFPIIPNPEISLAILSHHQAVQFIILLSKTRCPFLLLNFFSISKVMKLFLWNIHTHFFTNPYPLARLTESCSRRSALRFPSFLFLILGPNSVCTSKIFTVSLKPSKQTWVWHQKLAYERFLPILFHFIIHKSSLFRPYRLIVRVTETVVK